MKLWQHTFSELSGNLNPLSDVELPFAKQPFEPASITPLGDPKYATAMLKGACTLAHQVLLERIGNEWKCIGHYVDDTILLHPSGRKMGLAEELFLRCQEHRSDLPVTKNFTPRGFSLLRRAHKLAIRRAIECGLPVREDVLADYPELRQHIATMGRAP